MEEKIYHVIVTYADGYVEETTIVSLPQFIISTVDDLASAYEADIEGVDIQEEVPA